MIQIETYDGTKTKEHFINPKYVVSIDELPDGQTEITMSNGKSFVTNKNIYAIKKLMNHEVTISY